MPRTVRQVEPKTLSNLLFKNDYLFCVSLFHLLNRIPLQDCVLPVLVSRMYESSLDYFLNRYCTVDKSEVWYLLLSREKENLI
ncbi:hypothetical protein VNO78_19171 [Psophocarpus tetragonolobus]|uniref:Uncharacterized protein n=1 Tax=Psophocarpus tetragonolobus TaxID=3891 RepID=A0AAN9S7W8_PSOTE